MEILSPASVCTSTVFPVKSAPSTFTRSFLSFSRSVFTTATYNVPSSSLLAIAEYAFVPFANVSTCSNSVPTTFVPLEKELENISNTFADGVEKKRKSPSPVPVLAPVCGTAWITACCVGPSESAFGVYQSTRQCF